MKRKRKKHWMQYENYLLQQGGDYLNDFVRTLQRHREVERRIDVWRRKWRVIKERDRKQWEREHGKEHGKVE